LARLAFLLGFVHVGTDTERRRFLDALAAEQMAEWRERSNSAENDVRSASSADSAQNASA
jgi:hypothetical protein